MERTATIKNVQATESELRAALASLEKPDRMIDKKGQHFINICASIEVRRDGCGENPMLIFVGLNGSNSNPGFAYVTRGDIDKIILKLEEIKEDMS